MSKKFKLGIDWHGVLDALPETISFLAKAIIANGGEVHIITGMTWNQKCVDMLNDFDIPFTHHFSIFDHHRSIGTEIVGHHERFNMPKIDDTVWDKTKGHYCRDNDITLHIDDTLIYNEFFTTPFARLWTHNKNPKGEHKDIRHIK